MLCIILFTPYSSFSESRLAFGFVCGHLFPACSPCLQGYYSVLYSPNNLAWDLTSRLFFLSQLDEISRPGLDNEAEFRKAFLSSPRFCFQSFVFGTVFSQMTTCFLVSLPDFGLGLLLYSSLFSYLWCNFDFTDFESWPALVCCICFSHLALSPSLTSYWRGQKSMVTFIFIPLVFFLG